MHHRANNKLTRASLQTRLALRGPCKKRRAKERQEQQQALQRAGLYTVPVYLRLQLWCKGQGGRRLCNVLASEANLKPNVCFAKLAAPAPLSPRAGLAKAALLSLARIWGGGGLSLQAPLPSGSYPLAEPKWEGMVGRASTQNNNQKKKRGCFILFLFFSSQQHDLLRQRNFCCSLFIITSTCLGLACTLPGGGGGEQFSLPTC